MRHYPHTHFLYDANLAQNLLNKRTLHISIVIQNQSWGHTIQQLIVKHLRCDSNNGSSLSVHTVQQTINIVSYGE